MYPDMAAALAAEHRNEMIAQAARASLGAEASRRTLAGQLIPAPRPPHGDHAAPARPRRAAAVSPGARRSARAFLPGALFPRYRVSWSRTTLAPAVGDRRGRSWIIVISTTRSL